MKRTIYSVFSFFLFIQLLTSCSSVDQTEDQTVDQTVDQTGLPTTCEGWQEKMLQADQIMAFLTDKYAPYDLYNVGTESDNKDFSNALNWYYVAKDELVKLNC